MSSRAEKLPADAEAILLAGVEAADAGKLLRAAVRRTGSVVEFHPGEAYNLKAFGRVIVVGAGKAAGPMAQAAEDIMGEWITGGVVAVPGGTPEADLPHRLDVVGGEHPEPGPGSLRAAEAIFSMASQAGGRDLLLCLWSGGASSVAAAPLDGLELEDLQAVWRGLLGAGLDIHSMNVVRKHLTTLGGGKLARLAARATIVSLVLSDVPGNRIDIVGSGPTAVDRSTFAEALRVLESAGIAPAPGTRLASFFDRALSGGVPETAKPREPALSKAFNWLIGSVDDALAGARAKATELGYASGGDPTKDPAVRVVASDAAELGRSLGKYAVYIAEAAALGYRLGNATSALSGGETPARLGAQSGRGGRVSELVAAAAVELEGTEGAAVAGIATDGRDGSWDAAGAVADAETAARARKAGVNIPDALAKHNTATVFEEAEGAIRTGPTRTNVMDLYLVLSAIR